VISQCKSFLRTRCGRPYRSLQRLYYGARRFLEERVFGTRLNAFLWRFKNLWDRGMAQDYIRSANHPHRQLIMDDVTRHEDVRSVLEIGCNVGPNLYVLARRFPTLRLEGIDVNRKAIMAGREWLESEGIANVELSHADLEYLSGLEDNSRDLIIADAVLMYFGPDRIEQVIQDAMRVASKGLILVEWHDPEATAAGSYYDGKWRRNYEKLLESFAPKDCIETRRIPEEVWGGEWAKMGCVVNVRLPREVR